MKEKLWTLGLVVVGVLIAAPIAKFIMGFFAKKPAAPATTSAG